VTAGTRPTILKRIATPADHVSDTAASVDSRADPQLVVVRFLPRCICAQADSARRVPRTCLPSAVRAPPAAAAAAPLDIIAPYLGAAGAA